MKSSRRRPRRRCSELRGRGAHDAGPSRYRAAAERWRFAAAHRCCLGAVVQHAPRDCGDGGTGEVPSGCSV
ncbi:hypothetical protein IP79_00890 [Porphyrobacter sp. AAP60]|nr:hypothetical protein IP79_00890 [Porphyrobacter sp. AAP60]